MPSMHSRRTLLAALAVAPLLFAAVPTEAATDTAMLQSYAGNYTGAATIKSDPPQSVHCRLTITPAATGVTYTGRCSTGMGSFPLAGIIAAKGGRIVASMSGGMGAGSASAAVTGVKRGGGVVFSSKQTTSMNGHTGTVSSTMAFTGGTIRIDFSAIDSQTHKTYAGSIPFAKVAG